MFLRNDCLRPTIRDCARTIGRRIPTSRFGGESESSSGSSHRDQPNGSCQSTPPSTTPSTRNAIFYPAASSRCFVPRRSLSGIKVGLPPEPAKRDETARQREPERATVAVPPGRAMKQPEAEPDEARENREQIGVMDKKS
jgi:hypothetical protein